MIDAKALGLELAGMVKAQLTPIVSRLEALERRFDTLPAPRDGRDADMSEVRRIVGSEIAELKSAMEKITPELPDIPRMIEVALDARGADPSAVERMQAAARAAVAELPLPKDGTSVVLSDVLPALQKQVGDYLEAIPRPQDGRSVSLDDVTPMIVAEIGRRIDALPAPQDGRDGKDGASVVLSDVLPALEKQVADYLDALPRPKDGASVTLDDVQPMIAAAVERCVGELPKAKDGRDGNDGENGKDGLGLAGAFIDRDGELVVTLSNGDVKKLGPVVGKDGEPGKPGRDGFNLEDFDATVMDDKRTVLLSFDRGDFSYKIELGFPVMIYRGVYREDGAYERGDTVTWGGSLWHCDADKATEKPGDGSKQWTLCAKKGRDGRDGIAKEARPVGPVRVGIPAGGGK